MAGLANVSGRGFKVVLQISGDPADLGLAVVACPHDQGEFEGALLALNLMQSIGREYFPFIAVGKLAMRALKTC